MGGWIGGRIPILPPRRLTRRAHGGIGARDLHPRDQIIKITGAEDPTGTPVADPIGRR